MSDATPDRYEWLLAKHFCAFADYVDAHKILAVGWPRLYPPMSDEWVSDTIDAIAEGVALMAGSDAKFRSPRLRPRPHYKNKRR
jgi:hypothetical protein